MNFNLSTAWLVTLLGLSLLPLKGDTLELTNGDQLSGQVLSVSGKTVVLQNEVLGKITVPRAGVKRLAFGTNSLAQPTARLNPASANLAPPAALAAALQASVSRPAAPLGLTGDTNVIRQIRDQMLAGSPEAAAKYDTLVNGLLSGKLDLAELRREAQSSAAQLRELKRELGPDAGDALDDYLQVLDGFIRESSTTPATNLPAQIRPTK